MRTKNSATSGQQQLGFPEFDELPAPAPVLPPPTRPTGPAPAPVHLSLFFALQPTPEAAERLIDLATELRSRHGLSGKLQSIERLHVTLRAMEDGDAQFALAMRAAAGLAHEGFEVSFDRALSFPGSGAFVLRSSDNLPALGAFRRQLNLAMGDTEAQAVRGATPHMTLLYDRKLSVAEHAIEPIGWRATAFALVRSHVGLSRHETLGAWPLS